MKLSVEKACRFTVPLGVALLWAGAAHAQRIPIEAVWSAGTALLAPLVAVPIKTSLVRFSKVDAARFHPWSLCLVEWVIWFPTAFILLRSSDSNLMPVVLPALLAVSAGFHRSWTTDASWIFVIFLCLVTPTLAVGLPIAAFVCLGLLAA